LVSQVRVNRTAKARVPKFCSESGTSRLVVMALMPSVEPVVEKAQHELYRVARL
jgi:hypothetical protein